MYDKNLNIDVKAKISASANQELGHIFDTVILDFAYSEKHMRVATVMRDYSLQFWDHRDNFQFESSINYNLP